MAGYVSAYPGKLIFPDGREVDNGGEINLTAEQVGNLGVAYFVDQGWIKPAPVAEKAKK
jgi:hypothetical protein